MAMPVTCSICQTENILPAEADTKKIKCINCGQVITAPGYYKDGPPPLPKAKPKPSTRTDKTPIGKKSGNGQKVLVFLAVFMLFGCTGLGTVGYYIYQRYVAFVNPNQRNNNQADNQSIDPKKRIAELQAKDAENPTDTVKVTDLAAQWNLAFTQAKGEDKIVAAKRVVHWYRLLSSNANADLKTVYQKRLQPALDAIETEDIKAGGISNFVGTWRVMSVLSNDYQIGTDYQINTDGTVIVLDSTDNMVNKKGTISRDKTNVLMTFDDGKTIQRLRFESGELKLDSFTKKNNVEVRDYQGIGSFIDAAKVGSLYKAVWVPLTLKVSSLTVRLPLKQQQQPNIGNRPTRANQLTLRAPFGNFSVTESEYPVQPITPEILNLNAFPQFVARDIVKRQRFTFGPHIGFEYHTESNRPGAEFRGIGRCFAIGNVIIHMSFTQPKLDPLPPNLVKQFFDSVEIPGSPNLVVTMNDQPIPLNWVETKGNDGAWTMLFPGRAQLTVTKSKTTNRVSTFARVMDDNGIEFMLRAIQTPMMLTEKDSLEKFGIPLYTRQAENIVRKEFNSHPGVSYTIPSSDTQPRATVGRLIAVNDIIYLATVQGPAKLMPTEEVINKFFDSLKFEVDQKK